MKPNIVRLIAAVIGVWMPQAWGQTTQPAREQERLVSAESVTTKDRGVVRQLVRYDFATGKETVLQRSESRDLPRMAFIDSRGRHLSLRAKQDAANRARRWVELASPAPGTPKRVFEEWQVEPYWPAAVSPDGRKIVVFQFERAIAIGDDTNVHVIPRKWGGVRPFSWSPDSRQVAFYYAPTPFEDDVHIQQHGVAVLTIDGELRELVKPSEATGTPESTSKDTLVGWGRSQRFVYYTAGVPPDDSARELPACRIFHPFLPTATYRVDIETGKSERIGLGEFCCVSPDETYVLLYPSPKPAKDGSWTVGTAKIDLGTKQVTYLPDAVRRPKISPSGKLVACPHREDIRCFRTADWKLYGTPVLTGWKFGVNVEDWGSKYRWITVDEDHAPGSAW